MSQAEEWYRKKNQVRNSYRCFNVIACNIHVEEFLSATLYILSRFASASFPGLPLGGDGN